MKIYFIDMRKLSREDFEKKAKSVHGNLYLYSKAIYKTTHEKVNIVCKKHGDFFQTPANHLKGKGCPICKGLSISRSRILSSNLKRNWDFKQPEGHKLIPLTKGQFVKVDNEDFDRLKNINWNLSSSNYAINNTYGLMHRFILGVPEGIEVDHVYHDTLDNRKAKLRLSTRGQNMYNTKPRKATSKYKGVCWDKENGLWESQITINYKKIKIGRYRTEEEAAEAYDKKAVELFGEFACLNLSKNINSLKNKTCRNLL